MPGDDARVCTARLAPVSFDEQGRRWRGDFQRSAEHRLELAFLDCRDALGRHGVSGTGDGEPFPRCEAVWETAPR